MFFLLSAVYFQTEFRIINAHPSEMLANTNEITSNYQTGRYIDFQLLVFYINLKS